MKLLSIALLLFISLLISACSSVTGSKDNGGTRFYSLYSMPTSTKAKTSKLRIGVGQLEIPRLLNRPQIVSRKNNTEVIMAENHQWGGSYKEELLQTLTDNLSTLLHTNNIQKYPWQLSYKPHFQVRIAIERFDGELGKSVTLKARWNLLKDNREILIKQTIINTQIKGNSYNDYVKAQSQTLISLSKKISQAIAKENP
jgi:hypothetical protein